MLSNAYDLNPEVPASPREGAHTKLCLYPSDVHRCAQGWHSFRTPLKTGPLCRCHKSILLILASTCCSSSCILLLVSQPASSADSTCALLDAEARTREPCRFHAQAWTSCGVPMKSLNSKAAAVPLPAVCWSSRGPATRLPELPWAHAPATKKPST